MSEILFENVSFKYPETENFIFKNFSIELPSGITSLIGQNGTGKSTLLLLGGGTILPEEGKVTIHGHDTASLRDEHARQEFVSFIFQNMEFETEENIGELLTYVHENGFFKEKKTGLIRELIEAFELEKVLQKKTQEISKGELQRTILAFSLLYGSRILIMDEPIFALEAYQKEKAMEYLCSYSREHGISVFYSAHELDISEKYSDNLLLFHKHKEPELGPTKEIFVKDKIEEAYEVPFFMLKKKEALFRDALLALENKE